MEDSRTRPPARRARDRRPRPGHLTVIPGGLVGDHIAPSPDVEAEGRLLVRELRTAAGRYGRRAVHHRDRATHHVDEASRCAQIADGMHAEANRLTQVIES